MGGVNVLPCPNRVGSHHAEGNPGPCRLRPATFAHALSFCISRTASRTLACDFPSSSSFSKPTAMGHGNFPGSCGLSSVPSVARQRPSLKHGPPGDPRSWWTNSLWRPEWQNAATAACPPRSAGTRPHPGRTRTFGQVNADLAPVTPVRIGAAGGRVRVCRAESHHITWYGMGCRVECANASHPLKLAPRAAVKIWAQSQAVTCGPRHGLETYGLGSFPVTGVWSL